jgi:hypothetical protein
MTHTICNQLDFTLTFFSDKIAPAWSRTVLLSLKHCKALSIKLWSLLKSVDKLSKKTSVPKMVIGK